MNFMSLLSAILAFIALILTAIALATNHWFTFTDPLTTASALNPVRLNDELRGLDIEYRGDLLGLWVQCSRDLVFQKQSCAYVGNQCYSNTCWLRNKKEKTCKDDRYTPVRNCAALQATRVLAVIGTLALIAGASLLVVSACVRSTPLAATGAVLTGVAAFFLMVAFAVFLDRIVKDEIDTIGKISWSFILFIVAWPLATVSSLLGCAASGMNRGKEDAFESQG